MAGGTEAGKVFVSVHADEKPFQREMGQLGGTAQKFGAGLAKKFAAAFATGAIIKFGKSCLDLGSDLAEVQNVVDVAFPKMGKQVDEFAKGAAASFGLSETMAKRYAGTFGAMSKAFGFSEKEAAKMGTSLTGLAGDVASFYNISQDEAYTKLKSVFTGETESLKDLGIVMTQASLDQYAMANGFGKTTKAMTEQEKVALRYQFVTSQLALASGDFARTSDSWANQTRLLALQFDSLRAAIGQGLITVLTPAIKAINAFMAKLVQAAGVFQKFTEKIFGKQAAGGADALSAATTEVGTTADDASGGLSDLGKASTKAAKSTKKAAKEMKKAQRDLAGFDKINKLAAKQKNENTTSPSTGGGTSGAGTGGGSVGAIDTKSLDNAGKKADAVSGKFAALKKRLSELQNQFMKGFKLGKGDVSAEPIKKALSNIKNSLKEIFTDTNVVKSFNKMLDRLAFAAGEVVGSFYSIGVSIVKNLVGGVDFYLAGNKKRVKKWLTDLFDITGEIGLIVGRFWKAVAEIFSPFGEEEGQKVTANIIGIFADAFMGIQRLALRIGRDILNFVTKPIVQNKAALKKAFRSILDVIGTVLGGIKKVVDNTVDKVLEVYDKHIKPLVDAIGDGVSELFGILVKGYNKYVAPVLKSLAKEFDRVCGKEVKEAIDAVLDALGALADHIKVIWNKYSMPFFRALAKIAMPILSVLAKAIGKALLDSIKRIAVAIKVVFKLIGFLIKSCTKLITPLKSSKKLFAAIGKYLADKLSAAILKVKKGIDAFRKVWDGIKNKKAEIEASVKEKVEGALEKMHEAWTAIEDRTAELVAEAKEKTAGAIDALKSKWNDWKTATKELVAALKDNVTGAWNTLKGAWDKFTVAVKNFGTSFSDGVTSGWNTLKGAWDKFSAAIKNFGTSFIDGVTSGWNTLKTAWDKFTAAAKQFSTTFADGVTTAFKSLKTTWETAKVKTIEFVANLASNFSNLKESWNSLKSKVENKVVGIKARLAKSFKDFKESWNSLKSKVKNRAVSIKARISTTAKDLQAKINSIIKGLSGKVVKIGLKFSAAAADLKKWVNANVMKKIRDALSNIPILPKKYINMIRLAQGGWVQKNTPQLAVVGDNRHHPEIVAPDDKLAAMARQAAHEAAGNSNNAEVVALLKTLISAVNGINTSVYLDGKEITKNTVSNINKQTTSTGRSPLIV